MNALNFTNKARTSDGLELDINHLLDGTCIHQSFYSTPVQNEYLNLNRGTQRWNIYKRYLWTEAAYKEELWSRLVAADGRLSLSELAVVPSLPLLYIDDDTLFYFDGNALDVMITSCSVFQAQVALSDYHFATSPTTQGGVVYADSAATAACLATLQTAPTGWNQQVDRGISFKRWSAFEWNTAYTWATMKARGDAYFYNG